MSTNNIKERRKELKLTQYDLASITGLSYSYISHLEKGVRINPSYSAMKKIANAFNCEISDIFEN